MTRSEVETILRRLSHRLRNDAESANRLLERVASHDEREALRDLLVEAGARALIAELQELAPACPAATR